MSLKAMLPITREWELGSKTVLIKRWTLRDLVTVTEGVKDIYSKVMTSLGDVTLRNVDEIIQHLPQILNVAIDEVINFLYMIEHISKEELEEQLTLNNVTDYVLIVWELNELGKTVENLTKVASLLGPHRPKSTNDDLMTKSGEIS